MLAFDTPGAQLLGAIDTNTAVCEYKWDTINRMPRDLKKFASAAGNRGSEHYGVVGEKL